MFRLDFKNHRPPGGRVPSWWPVFLLIGLLTAITWLGWKGGLLEGQYLVILYFILLGVLLNVVLLVRQKGALPGVQPGIALSAQLGRGGRAAAQAGIDPGTERVGQRPGRP